MTIMQYTNCVLIVKAQKVQTVKHTSTNHYGMSYTNKNSIKTFITSLLNCKKLRKLK